MIEKFLPTLENLGFTRNDIEQYSDVQFDYLDINLKEPIELGLIIDIAMFFTDRFDIGYKMCQIIPDKNKITIRYKRKK